MERINRISYEEPALDSTLERKETEYFLTGPMEFLAVEIADALKSETIWAKIFGDNIDPYARMDYSFRNLPCLRIYDKGYTKENESWFITGDIIAEMILPPNLRREETQQITTTLSSALLQQFRRPTFFETLATKVPGLNELGKRFDVDKSLAFEFENTLAPIVKITMNVRIDLRAWDSYMESDNRTKDDPFIRTLGDLENIVAVIQGLNSDDSDDVNVELSIDQTIE